MLAQLLTAIHTPRNDNRLYSVERTNEIGQKRIVKKLWLQLDDHERASIIQAEKRAYHEALFCIYDF